MQKVKVLHVFKSYLPPTQNWIYLLLKYSTGLQHFVAADQYLKHNFYLPEVTYMEHPFGEIYNYQGKLSKYRPLELINKILFRITAYFSGGFNRELYRFASENKVDIIHAHFADAAWDCHEVAKKLGLPLVISFYGWDYEKLPYLKPVFKQHFKKLFIQAKMIICEGPHGVKILEKAGCSSSKLKVVKLGVEVERIPFHKRDKNERELRLVQVATFTEKKGHIYTVLAFKEALKECPNMHLTLIGGDGGQKEKIIQLIKENNLEGYVQVEDRIDWSELHERLKDFHVFIHPSCYAADMDCEGGAPIILLDAQATGMPVISTQHCDIHEEVVHGKTGWLADEKDIESISKIIRLAYHLTQEEYMAFCENARSRTTTIFSVSKIASEIGVNYNTIV